MSRSGFTLLLALLLCSSCMQEKRYKFFVAGHTYGNPDSYRAGMHPPFVAYLPELNADPEIELGFLTGDILKNYCSAAFPEAALADIEKINVPVHIAAGNHDIDEQYQKYFGEYYYSFMHKGDLHVILVPGLDDWNITGQQLAFLQQTLEADAAKARHIFIYLHELIWWSPSNKYRDIKINNKPHYPGSSNFAEVVKPLLQSYPNDITLFAGDLGATSQVSAIMYDKIGNITLIASGMGSGTKDNIIVVHAQDSISYEVVGLDRNVKLKRIEEYQVEQQKR